MKCYYSVLGTRTQQNKPDHQKEKKKNKNKNKKDVKTKKQTSKQTDKLTNEQTKRNQRRVFWRMWCKIGKDGKQRLHLNARGTPSSYHVRVEEEQILPVARAEQHEQDNYEVAPVARTKQHEQDNCCFADKNNTKRKKIPA